MNRLKIAQYIALGATVSSVIGILILRASDSTIGAVLLCIGFLAGLVSYIFGGLLTAIKMAGKIAKFGWVCAPFPVSIATTLLSFVLSIYAFICLPIIPIRKAYKESESK